MAERIETLIVGGGQAGLATSYYLRQANRDHVVLEQAAQAGHAWRDGRWDSFTLVTPNWSIRLPGMEYQGGDPDSYMPREELVRYFEQYVEHFNLPVQYGVKVIAVEQIEGGYSVMTAGKSYQAANVVMATGLYQQPKIPPSSARLPADILQLHSGQYRNPGVLPPGAVLVVGTGQSGCQIAEELYFSGRKVYLSVGTAGRAPRRYRGKDTFDWLNQVGFFDRTLDKLPSPQAKFAANPQLSGKDGGHALNLHQFARDGVTLLGRLQNIEAGSIQFAPDLMDNLAKADKLESDIIQMIDGYIAKNGIVAPDDHVRQLRDGYDAPVIEKLDLKAAGITSIIWARGYQFDFSLVKLPIFDEDGYPAQQGGVTAYPGLYFVGLPWLPAQKSGLLLGVRENAAYIAADIESRKH